MQPEPVRSGKKTFAPAEEGLACSKLRYPIAENHILYNGLSLSVPAGKVYAVMGESGGGKTTLFRLLMGLYPLEKGQIRLFDADITAYDRNWLWDSITYVTQETALFAGTIRENLCWRNKRTDEEIWAVLSAMQLSDWIASLPMGLDTRITDGGSEFSGGQRKSLVAARAMLDDRDVMLLDEWFAGIDSRHIEKILQLLREDRSKRLVLIITHDELVASSCDATITM